VIRRAVCALALEVEKKWKEKKMSDLKAIYSWHMGVE